MKIMSKMGAMQAAPGLVGRQLTARMVANDAVKRRGSGRRKRILDIPGIRKRILGAKKGVDQAWG